MAETIKTVPQKNRIARGTTGNILSKIQHFGGLNNFLH